MQVWKYELPLSGGDLITLNLPRAEFLTVHEQYGGVYLWALVDPQETGTEQRTFRIVGTGHDILEDSNKLQYRGTAHLNSGSLVFHVFEVFGA